MVTLTSSIETRNPIQRDFRRLVMRLRRRGILKDYIRVIENTQSGLEHIHMIYRGSYVAQRLLSHMWEQIHQAPVVDIRSVKRSERHIRGAARELAKYMAKGSFRRYAWSWGWVYKGFVKTWTDGKRLFRQIAFYDPWHATFSGFLSLWHTHLRSPPPCQNFLLLLEFSLLRVQRTAEGFPLPGN
ncbi:hypothetical protein ES703_40728 [subsurface metagenome]